MSNWLQKIYQHFADKGEVREQAALTELKARYHAFRIFLENNGRALELLASIDSRLMRDKEAELRTETEEMLGVVSELVDGLNLLSHDRHARLYALYGRLSEQVEHQLSLVEKTSSAALPFCVALNNVDPKDVIHFGKKAANLARLKQMALPVPDGFACSTTMCRELLAGQLTRQIHHLESFQDEQHQELEEAVKDLRQKIIAAPIPDSLNQALKKAYGALAQRNTQNGASPANPVISVRSSGATEDSADFSFAGQYTTILNVQGIEALFTAFKEVIASAFSARAISYRKNAGLSPFDFDLAVLCQILIIPDCAGVLFTHDPANPDSGRMIISAVPGMGTSAVDGSAPVDLYRPPRFTETELDQFSAQEPGADWNKRMPDAEKLMDGAQIAHKTHQELPSPDGGLCCVPYPEEQAKLPLLSPKVLGELSHLGQVIESLEASAQDIEWAWTENTGLTLLQSRPLHLSASRDGQRIRMPAVAAPLMTGNCASAGSAIGRVRMISSGPELNSLYDDLLQDMLVNPSILILPQSIVDAAQLLPYCAGVVIDVGNPTDHLSCVAREYGIPLITGTEKALSCLRDRQWVILDADNGLLLEAPESLQATAKVPLRKNTHQNNGHHVIPRRPLFLGSEEKQSLRNMVVPLNLTDAFGPTFSPSECRSVHDIIRYTHEMAVLSMFHAGDTIMEYAGSLLRPLDLGIPFSFLVIDVGGGVRKRKQVPLRKKLALRDPLFLNDILSIPLRALCEGLLDPSVSWHSAPDAQAMAGIVSRTMFDAKSARPVGSFNYALTARDYLNLNARMEFHFAMLDAVCGRDSHANYIRFRFKGGGASAERSSRRARFLQYILEHNAFYTSVVGDLITASLTGASREIVYERLIMLGRLFGFSRFLDGVMTDEEKPAQLAEQFLAGRLDIRSVVNENQA